MTPEKFREARVALGLTQEQLASLIGVQKQAVGDAEKRAPDKGTIYQLMTLIAHYGQDALDVLRAK